MIRVLDITKDVMNNARSSAPCILFVGVKWCGHCTKARPILEKVAGILGTTVPVYYVDADKHPDFAKALGVKSYPTIVFASTKHGLLEFTGERTPDAIASFVCQHSAGAVYNFCGKNLL